MRNMDNYESPYQYTHYGAGFGRMFESQLYTQYKNEIDPGLVICDSGLDDTEINDIVETLKLCLSNKKDFYSNAKPYMREQMENYKLVLDNDIQF